METAVPLSQSAIFANALARIGSDVERVERPDGPPLTVFRWMGVRYAPRATGALGDVRIADLETPAAPPGFVRVMTPGHVAEMDLTGSPDDRIAAMGQKSRNRMRRASEQVTCTFRTYDPKRDDWLLAAERDQRKAKGYKGLPVELAAAMARDHRRSVIVGAARKDRIIVSAALIILHLPVATYHIGWSSKQGRGIGAQGALLMQAADWLASKGAARLDLGLIETDRSPGLARFKLGLGAEARTLGGTWLRLGRA